MATPGLTKDEEAGVANLSAEQPPPYQADYGTTDNVPPSYGDTSAMDPPPTYESIYGEFKAARAQSSSFLDFVKKAVIIVLGTIGCTICVGIILAVPVSMIVIGSMYLHDCPAEKYIPIYLIVAGVFGVLKNISSMIQRVKNRKEEHDDENAKTNPFDGLVSCFLLAWFIAGNVWIYRIYDDWSSDPDDGNDYCDPTLYWFAFWITTATYIVMAFSCLCCVCFGGLVALCTGTSSTN